MSLPPGLSVVDRMRLCHRSLGRPFLVGVLGLAVDAGQTAAPELLWGCPGVRWDRSRAVSLPLGHLVLVHPRPGGQTKGTVSPCCAWTWPEVSPLAGRLSAGPGPRCPFSSPGPGQEKAELPALPA